MDPGFFYGTKITILDSFGNERKIYNAKDVLKAIDKFVYENYRGLADLTYDVSDDATLFISVESLATFLNDVFNFLYGRAFLKIEFTEKHGKLHMYMEASPQINVENEEARRFLGLARDTGFEFYRVDGRVTFVIDCHENQSYTVYVPLAKDDVRIICNIFENVYYKQKQKKKQD